MQLWTILNLLNSFNNGFSFSVVGNRASSDQSWAVPESGHHPSQGLPPVRTSRSVTLLWFGGHLLAIELVIMMCKYETNVLFSQKYFIYLILFLKALERPFLPELWPVSWTATSWRYVGLDAVNLLFSWSLTWHKSTVMVEVIVLNKTCCLSGRVQLHCWQVHWWERQTHQRDVQLCQRPSALHYLHGWDRRYW